MAKTKGKFILMACSILELHPEAHQEASHIIKRLTGTAPEHLDPEGWYDVHVSNAIIQLTEKFYGVGMARATIKLTGRRIYPTIARTVGIPKELRTTIDWLKWEGKEFLDNHQGRDIVPRKYLLTESGHVVIEAVSPYTCLLLEGIYEGILGMRNITSYTVKQTRCVIRGDPVCVYDITWQEPDA